ncbi:MAG: S8 family serine peptidase [Candidatus Thorarchaeota archaeon]
MQKKAISTLLVLCLIVSSAPVVYFGFQANEQESIGKSKIAIDFNALAEVYGDDIPVVAKFDNGISGNLLSVISNLGLRFSLGSLTKSHVGPYYLLEGNADSLEALVIMGVADDMAVQTTAQFLESPRDISIPEINADDVWKALDNLGRNVTGEGVLIADLDSGVDWLHPELWFADGGSYPYVNATSTGFLNGTDAVDFNRDFALTANETLYALDLDRNGFFDVKTEWIWADNLVQNAIPDAGELFFVVNDTNDNGRLDGFEDLVLLGTPKTRYIVEMDGTPSPSLQVWDRSQNLTSSTHRDTMSDGGGHGTAVAGILLGGQLGYRKWVGVAPDAELMMIRVIGDENTTLSIEAGLSYANATGADVILTEIGSWTYQYLDGSSLVEAMIDTLVADGIPVISPSGNLGGADKHSMFTTAPFTSYQVDFLVPPAGGEIAEDITNVYITILSVDPTDFALCNFSLIMDRSSFPNYTITIYLHPGSGYGNFVKETGLTNFDVESFISTSSRGTSMLGIWIHGNIPTITIPPWHKVNITTPDPTTFHGYISDDQSSWSGGCTWTSDVTNDFQITWPSTADSAISVASYNTRFGIVGDLASYSSRGPRIDGVMKQSISAPGGYDIITTYANGSTWLLWYNNYGGLPFDKQFGTYRLFSGTSAAGPHVAGCAALLLQGDPDSGSQIKSIIESTARTDGFTGATPNNDWGWGKLDADAAAAVVLADTDPPEFGVNTRTPTVPNATEYVVITVEVTDVSGVHTVILSYYNGTAWTNVTMTWNGSSYNATIPALPAGTTVNYRFYANDTLGFSTVSSTYSYTVSSPATTTTTTTTTPTTPPPGEPDYLRIAILLSAVFIVIVIAIVLSRRRPK